MKKTLKAFPLSLLSLSVIAGLANAEEKSTELSLITVNGNAVPTIVTDKSIDQRVATDLKQVLKNQVGVAISGGNGVAQYYNIRNIGEDKINLEVDGTGHSSTILHHQGRFMLDPSFIKRIEVEKGTGLASSGIGALAGVVRVTTVDAKDLLKEGQPVGLKIGATASSNRGLSQNVAAYANQNGFDALFTGSFVQDGNYKDGKGDKAYGSKIGQSNYLAKLGYDFNENNSVRVSLRQEYQKGRRLPTVEFAYDPTQPENAGESDSAQRQRTLNVEYNGKNLGVFSSVNVNAFHNQIDDYKPPKAKKGLKNESTSMEVTKVFTSGANLNLANEIGSHTLKYGVNYRKEKSEPSVKDWFDGKGKVAKVDEQKTETAAYLEAIWDLDPVTLTTGVRYDYFKYRDNQGGEASHGQFNPSLGIIYSVTPNFALTATASQASRAPRLNEALLANEGFAGTNVDKNIKPETARRGEVGFKWDYEGFSLAANYFQQNIKDLVIFNKSQKTIYNDGKLKMHGYEAEASYVKDGLKARVAVSHAKPTIHSSAFSAGTLQEDPYYFWNVGRQWLTSLSYRFNEPSIEIGWTGRYFERVKYEGKRDNGEKAGYGVHDLTFNWQPLKNDTLNLNLGVNNVFNKHYRSQGQRGNAGFFERGREFVAGFNYRF